MKTRHPKPSKLTSYLTASLGAGCLAGQADAAILVTFYGPGAQNSSSTPATPAGISVGLFYQNIFTDEKYYGVVDAVDARAAFSNVGLNYFTDGESDLASLETWGYGQYRIDSVPTYGATLDTTFNYANISFDGDDDVYEAVGQFYLDGAGGGYLVALAVNDDGSALSISAGKTAIDAVPEPSALALLALGAGGLITRRQRKAA